MPAVASPRTTLTGRRLLAARIAWIIVAVLVVGIYVAAVPVAYAKYQTICYASTVCDPYWRLVPTDVVALRELGLSVGFYATYRILAEIIYGLAFYAIGTLIFWKKSDNWVALVISVALMTFGALNLIDLPSKTHPSLGVSGVAFILFGYISFIVAFYLFPDGRFVPRWTRWLVPVWVLYLVSLFILPEESPLNPWSWPPVLRIPLVVGMLGTIAYAQIYRYVRVSGSVERQQIKWVVFGLAAALAGSTLVTLPMSIVPNMLRPGTSKIVYVLAELPITNIFLLLIPMSIGMAILRYRLWDIDVLINRTLVYGALTATVVGLYVLVVGGLGTLLRGLGNPAVSLLATGVVAVLFAPLRYRLQRGVNRLMYGERDDPYRVLSGLGKRLETSLAPNAVLPTIVETVASTLKLPYAAIILERDEKRAIPAAEYGKKDAVGELVSVPLSFQREVVGELLLAPRTPGETFSKQDLRLLEDLSRQIGVAAHAVRLTADLQRSRERLVTAREEERRRLRRDLHDGVGPQLAALILELETASELVSDDPEASALMAKLSERTRDVVSDVRRSVHALRPPSLDELGLLGALREGAAQYSRGNLRVAVEALENLPHLPAAVEVACYRIAQEAMTNVVRHAEAGNCWVRIALDEEAGVLHLVVEDDGRGIRENNKPGVGMNSMRERAEELGGRCAIELGPQGGTLVSAVLPCRTADDVTDRRKE